MACTCWILSDGRIGTENNARGLAEALGLAPHIHRIGLRQPWKGLAPWLLRAGLDHAFTHPPPEPPWPDVLITAGRTPAVGSLWLAGKSPSTVRIHITSPGVNPSLFDLVIAPAHDRLTGPNVLTTLGAIHRVTPAALQEAREVWAPRWAHLPRPWHAVLAGGDTHGYRLDVPTARDFMTKIRALGGSVLATASRRTGAPARAEIERQAHYLWDGNGPNPFMGLLALADTLFVTADSLSMLSEAASSGKTTCLLPLPGHSAKHSRCHETLRAGGYLAEFTGMPPPAPTRRLDDMAQVLPHVRELLVARGKLSD